MPFAPDFSAHGTRIPSADSRGIAPVRAAADPIDAAIAVSNEGMNVIATRMLFPPSGTSASIQRWVEEQATDLNDLTRNPWTDPANNDWAADWHRARVTRGGSDGARVDYLESPNEAKRRMIQAPLKDQNAMSFHSAIPMNAMHSRRAVAFDLAIGQAKSIDDEAYYAYLCRVADWRLDWMKTNKNWVGQKKGAHNQAPEDLPSSDVLALYNAEGKKHPDHRKLLDDTSTYRQAGTHPVQMNILMPALVVSQTVGGRQRGAPLQKGGTPPQGDRI